MMECRYCWWICWNVLTNICKPMPSPNLCWERIPPPNVMRILSSTWIANGFFQPRKEAQFWQWPSKYPFWGGLTLMQMLQTVNVVNDFPYKCEGLANDSINPWIPWKATETDPNRKPDPSSTKYPKVSGGDFFVLDNFGGGGSIHSHFPLTPWNSANITVNHLMLGRWVDSPQRGDRNPPSQSIPALKGDDGQLVRICGTVTRAGPVKAGMLWKSWRSEWIWRRGTSHFPKVSFRGCSWDFVFFCWIFLFFHFTSAIWDILIQIMILQPDVVRNRNLPCFFVVANLNHCRSKNSEKRKNTDDGRSLPVTWLVTGDIAWRKSWNGLPGISCCTRCTDSKM